MSKQALHESGEPTHSSKQASPRRAMDEADLKREAVNPLWSSLATHVVPGRGVSGADDPTPLQTKLSVGAPDDAYEQEADAVAERVMRMPASPAPAVDDEEKTPALQPKPLGGNLVQRLCAECEEEIEEQESVPGVQTKAQMNSLAHGIPLSVEGAVLNPGAGTPLHKEVRARIESSLGADLEPVRVHSDAGAQQAAQSFNAKAFTHQNHIYLGKGQSPTDLGLMAHEATHVVQQGHADSKGQFGGYAFSPRHAPQTHIQRYPMLPGYAQRGDTCGAASLVSAMMIWDRQRRDPAAPNDTVVSACNIVLTYLVHHRRRSISAWNARGLNGATLHRNLTDGLEAIRDHARLPGSQISETEYQAIGVALYVLYLDGQGGLSAAEISSLQSRLGLETQSSDVIQSFDDIFSSSIITGLDPGQIAQVGWYVKTGPPDASGMIPLGMHAFLIGRLDTGEWFLSDQGPSPPREIQATSRTDLETAIRIAAATDGYWLLTGTPTTLVVGGWTGVKLLAGPAGVESKAQSLLSSGQFLGEVDAAWNVTGNRLHAGAFVSRHYSLSNAETVNTANLGGVIVEMPKGVFNYYRTELVSDDNLLVSGLDTGDSSGGALMRRTFYHAWLRLCSENACRASLLKIY